jgi:filamentous hemagglutinin
VLHPANILIDERGFPVFDEVAKFDTNLPDDVASVRRRKFHMRMGTQLLNEAINRGEVSAPQFSPPQLSAIRAGEAQIPGLSWHHHQQFGRMQLVPRRIHQAVGHTGGYSLWY